ncbi:MAG: sialate O-acetylesterase [Luteolibacter sp.]
MKRTGLPTIGCFCALVTGFLPAMVSAELSLGSLFTDNAVLQRDMQVPVWGTADAGGVVSVKFADQEKTATANANGKWKVELDPLSASFDPETLTVSSATHPTIECGNILVGEVWICSGQSNMQMSYGGIPDIKALIPAAKNIRSFAVKRTVAFTEQDTCEGEWMDEIPDSAVGFAFAHFLEKAAEVPVGIILSCWGSSSIEAWMPRDMTETVPHFKKIMDEFDADAETRDRIASIIEGPKPWPNGDDVFLRRQSNILYNAMIHPLAPYASRGLVWYQGERNTQSMFGMLKDPWFARNSGMLKYGDTLTNWIQRYRAEWGRDDFHFLIVMLPGYHKPLNTGAQKGAEHPGAHSWAWMRESQLQAQELANASVVNTIDLGDVKNIHPKDKLPIGQRLALLAARDTLGQEVEAEGPVLDRVDIEGDQLVVHLDHSEGLKTIEGKAPTAFWVADDSAKWVKAEAELKGDTVVLRSSELSKPLYVRYAFAGKPNVNLINSAGLPAYPFRTDKFKP